MCNVAGGPFQFTATRPGRTVLGLEEAHRDLHISPEEFDEVAAELARSLDAAKVPEREKGEVLAAFAAHKGEVTEGYPGAVGWSWDLVAHGLIGVTRTLPFARLSSTN